MNHLMKGEEKEIRFAPIYLEEHLLQTPPMAIVAARKEAVHMLGIADEMVNLAMGGFLRDDYVSLAKVESREYGVDDLRRTITDYLVNIMEHGLSFREAQEVPALIRIINDIERIGDHAENLKSLAEQKSSRRSPFSSEGLEEIKKIHHRIRCMIETTRQSLSGVDAHQAHIVLQIEGEINALRDQFMNSHIQRLKQRSNHVISGLIFLDLIGNFERIGDHLTNIAEEIAGHLA
ncbi:MAG: Na/Pi cotransporter family protein [bacterium]